MANAYIVQEDGSTAPMNRIRCKNEDRELQLVLKKNHDLLPGNQMNPEYPRRWLMVEREMPVPDPASGSDRWSIDFFFVDQGGMPTFVECKRYDDPRSRREVIGQMLDYAANGHYCWTNGSMRRLAEKNALLKGMTLEDAVRNLHPDDELDADTFFQRVEDNLKAGQVRLVFFLEESSMELRSVVDFLNKQMERCEVLIVEARQYLHDGTRIVVPTLFGYTEEACQVKRTVTVTTGSRKKWDEESFLAEASQRLDAIGLSALQRLYRSCESFSDRIRWGTGTVSGSFNPVVDAICKRAIISATSEGVLSLNLGWLDGSEQAIPFRDDLAAFAVSEFNLNLSENLHEKYPQLKIDEWAPHVDALVDGLHRLIRQHRGLQ